MKRQAIIFSAKYRLAVFIILSIFAHAVWFISNQTMLFNIPAHDNGQIAVHINKSVEESHKNPAPVLDKPPKVASHTKTIPTDSQELIQTKQQHFRSKVLSHVNKHLKYTFTYPNIARRQGWQGLVLLGFHVNSAGNIQNIHIIKSSGYSILDESAVTALNQVRPVKLERTESMLQLQKIEIPIIYRLEG